MDKSLIPISCNWGFVRVVPNAMSMNYILYLNSIAYGQNFESYSI